MSPKGTWLVVLLLILTPQAVDAAIRPSFSERYSAWHATDVIVVDGKGTVLETWKGNLKPGDMLALAPLQVPKDEVISWRFRDKSKEDPERVTGARTVLFLKRQGNDLTPASRFGGMNVSVVWIEGVRLFAFRQVINPGPTRLVPLGLSEKELKAAVGKADSIKQAFTRAAAEADPEKRAKAIIGFIDSDIYGPYWDAFRVLGGCGKAALPECRKLLADPKRFDDHPRVIEAMSAAGGQDARADLLRLLEEEHAYWAKTGPKLAKPWWGQAPMTSHYGRLHTTLYQLARIGIAPDQEKLVRAVRDLSKSLPQLDGIGDGQIANAAEAVLRTSR